jgi:hypothetical protein
MPKKKKTVKSGKAVKKNSSFFQTHKHLKWLLPLLLLVIVGSLFVVKHTLSDQNIVEKSAVIKQEIKQAIPLHLDQEKLTPTVTPVETGF